MIATEEFVFRLRRILGDDIKQITDELVEGAGANDYAQYKQNVGAVQGIRIALTRIDELVKEANEIR